MDQTVLVTGCSSGLNVPGLGVYTASKFALESAMDALRQELAGTSVDVVMVRPGAVATRFYDPVLEELRGLDRAAAWDHLYYRTLDAVGVVARGGPGVNPPDRVAETIHLAAEDDDPDPVCHVGAVAALGTLSVRLLKGRVRDRATELDVRAVASDPVQGILGQDAHEISPEEREERAGGDAP
jgi:hypothetical protein